jgi:phospholipase/lecithinase/hemolysin
MHSSLRWLGLAAVLVAAQAQAQFSGLVFFGDSLSDSGNANQLTGGLVPGPNYWNGRVSNGPVWSERFAQALGFSAQHSLSGGTNYAYAFGRTGSGNANLIFPNVGTQIGSYLSSNTASGTHLYSIWAGANNYNNGETNPAVVVGDITNHISTLYAAGARRFLIPNLPLLGNTPANIGGPNQAGANFLTTLHNQALANALQQLRFSLAGVTIYEMDVASQLNAIQANPAAFGLTNVTQAALVNGSVVSNVDEYLFYDNLHPTRVGHQLIANTALQAVPEPMTMTVLALGAVAALRRRNR